MRRRIGNPDGGINGKRLVYGTRNSSGNAADISRAATELINAAKAGVLFGPIGDIAMRALSEMPLPELQGTAIFDPLTGLTAAHADVTMVRGDGTW